MTTIKLWWLWPLACLAACGSAANHAAYNPKDEAAKADSAAAPMPLNSPERKIIRTADFRCKVNNVLTAVNGLESAVNAVGGIVQESNLQNSEDAPQTIYYKPDSMKEFHSYTTTATLTLRVPVASLDSVIHAIPAMVSFIDARALRQNDVTAEYNGNQLRQALKTKVYTAEKAVKLAKKPEDLVAVQQYEDNNANQLINNKVQDMRLLDQVSYATLTIALSQPPQIYAQVIPNVGYITTIPFTTQLAEALREGWSAIEIIFVGICTIWPFILMGIAAFFIIKKLNLKRRPLRPSAPSPITP